MALGICRRICRKTETILTLWLYTRIVMPMLGAITWWTKAQLSGTIKLLSAIQILTKSDQAENKKLYEELQAMLYWDFAWTTRFINTASQQTSKLLHQAERTAKRAHS